LTVPSLIRAIERRLTQRRSASGRWRMVLAWSGMRRAVSLAVALALPFTTDASRAFPRRDLIVFLTFGVVFFTLVV
jgi:CPA1 family monovalent cation:H+ antiporter